tara:strand:- start:178 stop:1323 length:1146 start_codon:yes stop_codon:yes gene_type:complete
MIKPLSNYKHERVVAIELLVNPMNIILISVYLPFYDSRNRKSCLLKYINTLTMVENNLDEFSTHQVVIGGDFNTELKGNSPFDNLIRELMEKYNLRCCDALTATLSNNEAYTYHHETLDQKKFNDHFLVTDYLYGQLKSVRILEDGDNTSDHLPIIFKLEIDGDKVSIPTSTSSSCPSLKWEKCSAIQKLQYSQILENLLSDSATSSPCFECPLIHCSDNQCRDSIQMEYDKIISSMKTADQCLPRSRKGHEKGWWTEDLSTLRQQNIEIQNLWKAEGKPRTGVTYEERLRMRAEYKHESCAAQKIPVQAGWDKIHDSMIRKNTNSFWKSWRGLHQNKNKQPQIVNGLSSEKDIADCFKDRFEKNCKPNFFFLYLKKNCAG